MMPAPLIILHKSPDFCFTDHNIGVDAATKVFCCGNVNRGDHKPLTASISALERNAELGSAWIIVSFPQIPEEMEQRARQFR